MKMLIAQRLPPLSYETPLHLNQHANTEQV
jgi:hypothetical protein